MAALCYHVSPMTRTVQSGSRPGSVDDAHRPVDSPFTFDVFLSHSSIDKAIVRVLAERLLASGLRVWFDEIQLRPGDSIPAKIEDGLENSRVLVLCMSASAFGSDWVHLESQT